MKYYLIAGEASGDLHAANVMHQLRNIDHDAEFRFFGGELMQKAGGTLVKHYREMAFMGLVKVLANLGKIKKNFLLAEKDLLEFQPDVLILVDYPGFNLRMAEFAKKQGIRVYYYISPKIWAWKTGRIKKIKKWVDEMFTILPFETKFYEQFDYPVKYVGNPSLDEVYNRSNKDETFETFTVRKGLGERKIVALLAGSRRQEIARILPVMAGVVDRFPDYQFVLAGAPSIDESFYRTILNGRNIPIVFNETYELLQQADAALVTSGTATLETAIMNVPQVVCYKMEFGRFMTLIRPLILKIPFFSLVNLIVNREIVKELFQEKCNPDNITEELDLILNDSAHRAEVLANYEEMRNILGGPGGAIRAAEAIYKKLTS